MHVQLYCVVHLSSNVWASLRTPLCDCLVGMHHSQSAPKEYVSRMKRTHVAFEERKKKK